MGTEASFLGRRLLANGALFLARDSICMCMGWLSCMRHALEIRVTGENGLGHREEPGHCSVEMRWDLELEAAEELVLAQDVLRSTVVCMARLQVLNSAVKTCAKSLEALQCGLMSRFNMIQDI